MTTIDRARLTRQLELEQQRFSDTHPRSHELFRRAQKSLLAGVPMNWMVKWAGSFPVFVTSGKGAHFADVDGHDYVDLCLGDTGAMTGHAPDAVLETITERMRQGVTFMLPTEDAVWVGEELARRFGLPYWQVCLTATDANRFSLRIARALTRRPKVLVFNYCYHGTVDETFATLQGGVVGPRSGNLGPQVNPAETTKVIEFNDIPALEAALAPGDVAAVLAEPVMTNIGIVHPDPGYHEALREITRRTGTLLIIDETHTICTGPGGYTQAFGLQPDLFVIGKPIGSGIPTAVYGMSEAVADRARTQTPLEDIDTNGIGGTLAGNALSLAAMRVTLEKVLTPENFERMIPLAERFEQGVEEVIAAYELPWIVKRLGCRAEYWFRPAPPRNGGEAAAAVDFELDQYMHLCALNRGVLLTPFHNMALVSPFTNEADIDRHTSVFHEAVHLLAG
jgi:glutamate-1-semialdehyde 2,1-aminomutase